ncbi:FAD-dependent oxidoreductase [Stenotrophomonas sp. HITSZ_GD]|uniref:NAD(P)/FAD-dependent oxidoreductase n=1 Tax=Stenotrophomonas sp. HITSZ_GD TaxID=3037248 RepID=UPI00240E73A3|nr:FAD-dependent oxidoreductase [Stenotrophomonas sp. HITSZ_GD]MDG2524186.1 FAD-dependent oxidoreductase [Stenotrophomonas sp. HITSZ_GD]
MRVAVIGSGIAGLATAWWLDGHHDVTLFEANDYLGGHTHTHDVEVDGVRMAVDTGFIVFNPLHYPLLTALFDELGVASQPTTMSFSMHSERSGVEYNATSLDGLFCQRRNLVSPRFWGMLADLRRFYRSAPSLLAEQEGPTLGQYLRSERYGQAFIEEHLLPMASALWSSPTATVLDFPARYLVQFMANHQMLQMTGRAPWRVVTGGSARYVDALRRRWGVRERLRCPVHALERLPWGVRVQSAAGVEMFDEVVLACHSDQALALLADADPAEREVLGAIRYQSNEAVLHTDASLLPRRRKAWAAWNAHVPGDPTAPCTVSYCMNLLQGLPGDTPLVVTLNRTAAIDPGKVLRTLQYAHPVHDHAAVRAQQRWGELQGRRHTWFAGAYWGWGFHEDGIRSARRVVDALRACTPRRRAAASDEAMA